MKNIKILIIFGIFLLINTSRVYGQSCSDYACVIRKVKKAIADKNYTVAFDNLESADGYPNKNVVEIGNLRKLLFKTIENEKNVAKKAKNDAIQNLEKANRLISNLDFSQDRTWVFKNGKFALINNEGYRLTEYSFDDAVPFMSNKLAIIKKDGLFYFINIEGQFVSKGFNWIYPSDNGGFVGKIDRQFILLDNMGGFDINSFKSYRLVDLENEIKAKNMGIARLTEYTKPIAKPYRFIGDVELDKSYQTIDSFKNGYAKVKLNDKWGFVNNRGQNIISAQFNDAKDFSEGLAAVKLNDKWGYIDTLGNYIVQPQFDGAEDFSNGKAGVYMSKDNIPIFRPKTSIYRIINGRREEVPTQYSTRSISISDDWYDFFYINKKGEMVIDLKAGSDKAINNINTKE